MSTSARKGMVRGGTSSKTIHADLKTRIVTGELEGGAPLRQDELAQEFGVSKIPVREALRQLEADGLVEFRPRRGAIVTQLSADDLADMMDVRIALECRALELAIPNMVAEDLRVARDILDEYGDETRAERWSELNARFHRCLYEPCGRRHLLTFINDLQGRMGAFMRLKVTLATGLERPHREHQEILEACAEKDVAHAVGLLRAHVETTQKEVAAHFRRQALNLVNED
ncbi:MAG: GntR family transcriptional regulator [Pseudomonadota bacterium]